MNCLAGAAFLKVLDMILNLMIPTPTICHDHEEQQRYELLGRIDEHEDENQEEETRSKSNLPCSKTESQ